MMVEIVRRPTARGLFTPGIKRTLRQFAQRLELPPDTSLSVLLTNDAEIHELNRDYRKKDRPTDVLSFSQYEGGGLRAGPLGDIVLSIETTTRQAEEKGWSLEEEAAFLLLHGLLHLLGFDHETDADAEVLDAETARVWEPLKQEVYGLMRPKESRVGR
jgi:probable rRNA maturation factor